MRRSTIILLIVFVLLGTLVWYMQQPGNPVKLALATATATSSVSSGTLINPNQGPVALVSIQAAGGKTVSIDKTGGQWVVKVAQTEPADQSLAEAAGVQALNLQVVKQFETAPDPAGTGLDKPAYTISVKLADGSTFIFTLGKATVTDSGYYASNPNGVVYILSKNEVDTLIHNFAEPPLLKTASPSPAPETETPNPRATLSAISTATTVP